jgi:hypothetical protein
MLTDSERIKGRPPVGTCAGCGQALYGGPLGPEHLRFRDDRDHTATPAT